MWIASLALMAPPESRSRRTRLRHGLGSFRLWHADPSQRAGGTHPPLPRPEGMILFPSCFSCGKQAKRAAQLLLVRGMHENPITRKSISSAPKRRYLRSGHNSMRIARMTTLVKEVTVLEGENFEKNRASQWSRRAALDHRRGQRSSAQQIRLNTCSISRRSRRCA
jgi:hypothetical protein